MTQKVPIENIYREIGMLENTSVPVTEVKNDAGVTTKTITTVERTHYVALKVADLDNGNIVKTNMNKDKGVKTFKDDRLDYDFKLQGLRLMIEADSTVNGWNPATAAFEGDLPHVLGNAEIEIVQGKTILSCTGREAFASHKNQLDKDKRTFSLSNPVQILAKEPFGIYFRNTAGLTTQALRVELDGIEMAVVSANEKMC